MALTHLNSNLGCFFAVCGGGLDLETAAHVPSSTWQALVQQVNSCLVSVRLADNPTHVATCYTDPLKHFGHDMRAVGQNPVGCCCQTILA